MALYFLNFFSVLVKGQSLQVTPDPVKGVLGGSVDITWTVIKKEQSDLILITRLYLGTLLTRTNLLYQGVTALFKQNSANLQLGDRIQVRFKESKYTQFNDTVTFTLVVSLEDATLNPLPSIVKSTKIVAVTGMFFPRKNMS